MERFHGKTALITGASSGIGEEMAKQLAAAKANLILIARRQDRLNSLAEQCRSQHNVKVTVIVEDLCNDSAAQNIFKHTQNEQLTVDILINNAGVGYQGYFADATLERYQNMMKLNMNALLDLTHLYLPAMLERKSGGILNVASVAGLTSLPYLTTYAATKAFVVSFTEGIWKEYKDSGVHFSALCPGPVATEFQASAGINVSKVHQHSEQTVEPVVKQGLLGLLNNRPIVETNLSLKLLRTLTHFVTRKCKLHLSAAIMKQNL